jgi:hypothetical protein
VENHNCNKFSRCYKEQAWLLKLPGRSPVEAIWQADDEKATGKNTVVVAEGGKTNKELHQLLIVYKTASGTIRQLVLLLVSSPGRV